MLLINGNLKNILINFNCNITKGDFPHGFITENRLYYIGNKPSFKYYNNMSLDDYNNIRTQ
jgi:hypothetical protein